MAYGEHIYIQKMGTDKDGNLFPCYDMAREFRFYGMEIPFAKGGAVKDLYANNWADEDGADEYVPDVLPIKAYDLEVKLAYKGNRLSANKHFDNLRAYLTGRNGDGSRFKIYSTYLGFGRRDVRLVEIGEPELIRKTNYDLMMASFTFRVNDPITEVLYDKDNNTLLP